MTFLRNKWSAIAALLGAAAAVAPFVLIEMRTAVYVEAWDRFVDAASVAGAQHVQKQDFPNLFAISSEPTLIATIFLSLTLAVTAIAIGLRNRKYYGTTYLGTAGILFGSMSLLWIVLMSIGAV
jgi:hypothetical protein